MALTPLIVIKDGNGGLPPFPSLITINGVRAMNDP